LHLVTSVVKRLQLAILKVFGAGRRKLKKTRAGQKDTTCLVQPGYETLSHQTMVPKRPDLTDVLVWGSHLRVAEAWRSLSHVGRHW
jgi:hypothetical protein